MVYWVSYCKTGIGEVIRVRGYDSILKTRKYASNYLKMNKYDWVAICKTKTGKNHLETIELVRGQPVVERYNAKSRRFERCWMNPDGTLGWSL